MPSVAPAVGNNEGRRTLPGPFRHNGGRAWIASNVAANGDHDEAPFKSRLCLYENDVRPTTAHHGHSSIWLGGWGRYSPGVTRFIFPPATIPIPTGMAAPSPSTSL